MIIKIYCATDGQDPGKGAQQYKGNYEAHRWVIPADCTRWGGGQTSRKVTSLSPVRFLLN